MSSITCFWRSSGMKRMPKASSAVRRSGEMTACEKYGGTAFRSCCTDASSVGGRPEQVGQRERRAELRRMLSLHAGRLRRVAVARQDALLEARHPVDHVRSGEVRGVNGHVDLARDARRALEPVDVPQRRKVLRHELADVGDDRGLRVRDPSGGGDHEANREHVLRALDGVQERAPAEAAHARDERAAGRGHQP